MTRRGWLAAITYLAVLALAGPAAAATRYASPTGPAAGNCEDPSQPCNLEYAVNTVGAGGDDIVVFAGDYPIASTLGVDPGMNLHGVAGQARPRIISSVPVAVQAGGNGTRVADMQVEAPRIVIRTVGPATSSVLERLTVFAQVGSGSGEPLAVDLHSGWLIRDSVVHTAAVSGVAVQATDEISRAVNVTAFAPDAAGIAFRAYVPIGGICVPPFRAGLNVTNSIARGGLYDLASPGLCSGSETLNVIHSNYRADKVQQSPPNGRVEDQGGNQHGDPLLAAPGSLDFHQLVGSSTIDAGAGTPLLGSADLDGEARTLGLAPDIGADEFPPPPPPLPAPAPPAPADTRAPRASLLAVSPSAFRAARRGRSVVRRGGGRVSYALDETATVTFTAQRRVRRKRSRRFRYVAIRGSFTHRGAIGGNRFRFSGRLRGRRLRRGRYRLTARPRDAAGNSGRAVRAAFRIR